MYDPKTVAFSNRWFTIWHVDPETDGSDDSCDWFGDRKTRANGWYPVVLDCYNALSEDTRRGVDFVWWHWRNKLGRRWWRHPRYHVHHWKLQVYVIQALQRWLWSRCCICGKRFRWGESVVTNSWHSSGPRWFHGETDVFYATCDRAVPCNAEEATHA